MDDRGRRGPRLGALAARVEPDSRLDAGAPLPKHESNQKVANIAIFVAGAALDFQAQFASPAQTVDIPFEKGVAFSNAPPLSDAESSLPPLPLNALVAESVDQVFRLVIDKSQNPGVDFSVAKDVVLGIDYTADLAGL